MLYEHPTGDVFVVPESAVGVTVAGEDAGLLPNEFVATTVHEYVVPFVRLETVIGLEAAVPVWVVAPVAEHVAV